MGLIQRGRKAARSAGYTGFGLEQTWGFACSTTSKRVKDEGKAMNFLEAIPAIRRIETDRDDLFAMEIVGHVTAADAENLFGLLEAAYALHPKIDVLAKLTDHDGVDWVDLSPETIEQGKAHALDHVRRCAAIGEPDWTADVQGLFSPSLPVELRHFAAEEEAEAWAWLDARPRGR
jgi:hypothetical protein